MEWCGTVKIPHSDFLLHREYFTKHVSLKSTTTFLGSELVLQHSSQPGQNHLRIADLSTHSAPSTSPSQGLDLHASSNSLLFPPS